MMGSTASHNAESEEPLDVTRLDPEERRLWEEHFASPSGEDGPAVRIWSFGYWCMLELGRIPKVVSDRLRELDPENKILQYQENVRRAGWEARLPGQPGSPSGNEP